MRLIDADKLKESISNYTGMFDDDGEFWVSLKAVLSGIDFAEAVDAVPVAHGRWVLTERPHLDWYTTKAAWYCSQCGWLIEDRSKRHIPPALRHCPNCTARMDGENNV